VVVAVSLHIVACESPRSLVSAGSLRAAAPDLENGGAGWRRKQQM
jgi:hypothetical protein